jgi:L-aspartate oxidase
VTKSALDEGAASFWSQGGIAAAISPDDSPALHAADTLAAGDGLGDSAVVHAMTAAGPAAVRLLDSLGVRFARGTDGAFACKLEAAHSRRRVLNAGGDATGAEIMRAVLDAARRAPSVTILERVAALDLRLEDGAVTGIVLARGAETVLLPTPAVVVATGGAGALWRHTTNPAGAIGQGLAIAARAGATLVDLEFVQFHPTALDVGRDPMPLASEALRGDGATLIDDLGERFMAGYGRAELSPRDVVARAVWARLAAGRRVFLDTREALGAALPARFPGLYESCISAGIDPMVQPIPVRPAAHYHMGGIAVDSRGRSDVPGLWACGEAAGTGLHGANRLASNSLLEAVVTAQAVAADLAGSMPARAVLPGIALPAPAEDRLVAAEIRQIMSRDLGVLRDAGGLEQAVHALFRLSRSPNASAQALLPLMIAVAALDRRESRGAHWRTDFPGHAPSGPVRRFLTWHEAQASARALAFSGEGRP